MEFFEEEKEFQTEGDYKLFWTDCNKLQITESKTEPIQKELQIYKSHNNENYLKPERKISFVEDEDGLFHCFRSRQFRATSHSEPNDAITYQKADYVAKNKSEMFRKAIDVK